MADPIDQAQKTEEFLRRNSLMARVDRARRTEGKEPVVDDEHDGSCRICGKDIPEARCKAIPGVDTCVGCQDDIERVTRQGRR